MAKFRRFDPRNKKASKNNHRKGGKQSHHMETKYFKQQKNHEVDQYLVDDIYDYLEDHQF